MEFQLFDLALLVSGAVFGSFTLLLYQHFRLKTVQTLADTLIQKAESDAQDLLRQAEWEAKNSRTKQQQEIEKLWLKEREAIKKEENRLDQKEDKLETRLNLVEKKLSEIERRELVLGKRRKELEEAKQTIQQKELTLSQQLEEISGLTSEEAKSKLASSLEEEVKLEMTHFIRKSKKQAEESADREAVRIMANAMNRLAVSCVSEATVNTVALPNDEMKGRIIGREGRNIRTLERLTGVNFIIDDTPGAVILSGFDPMRLHVAKTALGDLVNDGRIHPTRIEEAVAKAERHTEKVSVKKGQDAALRAGCGNLQAELVAYLGKLHFRYSLGQNVLEHSLEVSYLLGLMAAELGLDERLAKRIGLLHDIGKAATHEMEGTHAIIGHKLALKYGESADVANGIGCHHNEMEPLTIEGSLCSTADALSASRPGARIEAVEEYIKRLKRLEELAYSFPGVERAYALQAGRELRIFVLPEMIDDAGILNLARDLSKRIESDLSYPGKIKVSVSREKRVFEYAV